jgi:poly(beta-D-mannuronate) C5 epimerase
MKRLILFLGLTLCALLACFVKAQQIQTLPKDSIAVAKPTLPDLSEFTGQSIEKMQASMTNKGSARIASLSEFKKQTDVFYSDKFAELARRQKRLPQVIVIENGKVDIDELLQYAVNFVKKTASDSYLVKLPIIIAANAVLTIDNGRKIYLSSTTGAFIFVGGQLFINNASIFGWNEYTQTIARYTGDKTQFRPFIMSSSGSSLYFYKSHFESLGYQAAGAYGIGLKEISKVDLAQVNISETPYLLNPPTGWIIASSFKDLYFGFYSYGAKDVVVLRNQYVNSVIYGIDRHDYSSNLIIAYNKVTHTQQRHGIIGSRFVNNSYIMHNEVSTSGRSGIMLDRQSSNNVVAFNKTYNNGGDGITVYESNDNLLYGNQVFNNQEHGIRLRNSIDITLQHNVILNNRGAGVYFHTRDLSDHTYRDLMIDPYEQRVSGNLVGGLIAGNQSGGVFSEHIESLGLSNINIEQNGQSTSQFRGDLLPLETNITLKLWEADSAIMIRPNEQ